MPSIAQVVRNKFLFQRLVYWKKTGSDAYGKPAYGIGGLVATDDPATSPVELACRWEDKEMELQLADGRRIRSKAYILLADKVEVGSLVMLGTIADWKASPSFPYPPTVNQGGREVLLKNTTPDIRNFSEIYECYV